MITEALALIFLGQLGTLARVGLTLGTQATFGPSSALLPALPSNLVGSFLMGVLVTGPTVARHLSASADLSSEALKAQASAARLSLLPLVRRCPLSLTPLVLGLRTGFCGCLTSFSSWNQDIVELFLHGDGWRDAVVAIVFGFLLPLASLLLGQSVAVFVYLRHSPINDAGVTSSTRTAPHGASLAATSPSAAATTQVVLRRCLLVCFLSSLGACVALFMLLGDEGSARTWKTIVLALLLAPIGVLTRWRLSKLNRADTIPLGTLTANVVACCAAGAMSAFLEGKVPITRTAEMWLEAALMGPCGALSTISTFMVELTQLAAVRAGSDETPKFTCSLTAAIYSAISIALGVGCGIASYIWCTL